MGKIKVVLWDIDGTLLNFESAERAALSSGFSAFGLGVCTDEMLEDYKKINRSYWQRLERGELSKQQVLEDRFREFFGRWGRDGSCAAAFNQHYQLALGDYICFHENGKETVQALRGVVKQYAVTNGSLTAQKRKLGGSGLDQLLDGVFISDVLGVEKPNVAFFEKVWEAIGTYDPEEVVIVGDSLTSDIQGGCNAGIQTCWFNPEGKEAPEGLRIDWQIRDLSQVLALCRQE